MDESGRFSRHFWLCQGMARAAGVRLSQAVAGGRLSRSDLSQMVAECCQCGREARCTGWMAAAAPGDRAPPEWCPLARRLAPLAPGLPADT